ncbi:class I SAM-dependent DNA methyltransferase [Kitasatospora purpeofusca]|uniref:class I SAM-dependent DNA methyltransferase n=1 Tax=Kitasatospora purpeofusca TaxID=67352 RepID=UPI0037F4D593
MSGDGNGALAELFWSVADLLRDRIKVSEYGRVMLPFTVLRRLDCARRHEAGLRNTQEWLGFPAPEPGEGKLLPSADRLRAEPTLESEHQLAEQVRRLIVEFPADTAALLDLLDLTRTLGWLADSRLLAKVVSRFAAVNLSPAAVPEWQMGQIFEELVRWCAGVAPDQYGEHTTPWDLAELTARLLLGPDLAALGGASSSISVHDPCCGTGGMFSAVETVLRSSGNTGQLAVAGQEINRETHALARLVQLMRGADPDAILTGDVLVDDRHRGQTFEYQLAAPPFGMSWAHGADAVRREAEEQGHAGRFGAGLPPTSDSSLLFVQHLAAHMRPAAQGGGRAAIVLGPAPMESGGAGSGPSAIRQWLLEQELLEGVVALPGGLLLNSTIPTYIWLLSNRRPPHLRGKVIALDGTRSSATLRRPVGEKRQYLTDQHIAKLVEGYAAARRSAPDEGSLVDGECQAVLLGIGDLGYREVRVEQPLRLQFSMDADILADLEATKAVQKYTAPAALMEVLGSLVGNRWPTLATFEGALRTALSDAGQPTELTPHLWKSIREAAGVTDPDGEEQTDREGKTRPDTGLRDLELVPLDEDVDEFIRREIKPDFPNAWADHSTIRVGYTLPLAPFHVRRPGGGFRPLFTVARLIPARSVSDRVRNGKRLLNGRDLRTASSAAELPEFSDQVNSIVARCAGGDIVGIGSNWRVLPKEFGEALTSLTVLRPINNNGYALCEWLRTRPESQRGAALRRVSMNMLVPIALIKDPEFEILLDAVETGRTTLTTTISSFLPQVFSNPQADIEELRHAARAAASQARLIGELVKPLEDPVWRAEWSYPYHVAALARQYRVAATPSDRHQTLLKLAESIARCIGVLALAIEIRRQGFTRKLQEAISRSGGGATWGTWHALIKSLVEAGPVPELPELERVLDPGGVIKPLKVLLDGRNKTGHAYRAPAAHKVEREISTLEPLVVAALESAAWLSAHHWDLVDTCNYATNLFSLTGRRLRGSHPDWESFVHPPRSAPLEPGRLYVEGPSSGDPLALWPVARTEVCTECDAPELFLINKINKSRTVMTLRCSKDHEIETVINS